MEYLNIEEVKEVSGARSMYYYLFDFGGGIMNALYNSGMNAYESGSGDAYLEAVRGGNLGA